MSRKRKTIRPWQEIAQEAQQHRDDSISRCPLGQDLSDFDIDAPLLPKRSIDLVSMPGDQHIIDMAPEVLLEMMAKGGLKAVDVTEAFLRRADFAQKLTNCVTELLPERALQRAAELDIYLQTRHRPMGPLHGLPISVKEMIGMKDLGLNAGYVAWWSKVATEDAQVLKILWDAGAVFFARTTQPQTMMHLETHSNLYGVTVNPYNRNLSAGGSSGGEGALVAMRGSVLGVGSDIGGSIRSPASNCGIYGFKPTAFRIPTDGWCSTAAGADPIAAVIGPLSTSLTGIVLFMRTVIDSKPWLIEPALVPLPWTPTTSPPPTLKIAIMYTDGIVTPHPPITRALHEMAALLTTIQNLEVVEWKPHLHDEAWAILSSLYFPDGGAETAAIIAESGEPWLELWEHIIRENPCVKKPSLRKLYYWQEEREAYRKEYAGVWNATVQRHGEGEGEGGKVVDVILCPAGSGVAPHHDTSRYWNYTANWNLLDYPAIVFPVSKVDRDIDFQPLGEFKAMSELDRENWELYDADEFDGLPVSLQLVGRRFEDEKVLAILEYVIGRIGLPFVNFP